MTMTMSSLTQHSYDKVSRCHASFCRSACRCQSIDDATLIASSLVLTDDRQNQNVSSSDGRLTAIPRDGVGRRTGDIITAHCQFLHSLPHIPDIAIQSTAIWLEQYFCCIFTTNTQFIIRIHCSNSRVIVTKHRISKLYVEFVNK